MQTETQARHGAGAGRAGLARLSTACLLLALLWPALARADETADFLKASAEAYRPYRGAVVYLHTGNAGIAALALEEMAERWARVCGRYRARPPPAFAADPSWRASLDEVSRRIEEARARIEAGDAAGAGAILGPIRTVLGDLRRRNGVVTFSDRIDAFSAALESLWVHRDDPPDLSDAGVVARLAAQARALREALETVHKDVPAALAGDPQLHRLLEGSRTAAGRLEQAIDGGDRELFIGTLRELRSFEQILWLNFG
jgi:hypothetical protein